LVPLMKSKKSLAPMQKKFWKYTTYC
jgi:hypothetical protein